MPKEVGPTFIRHELPILAAPALTGIADGTGAITLVDSFTPGYVGTVEKLRFVSGSIATGTSASQVFKLRKGGATGTVIATLQLDLADVNAVGKFKQAAVSAANDSVARFSDTETLSLTRDSGGTAYTKFEGLFTIVVRQKPQARA